MGRQETSQTSKGVAPQADPADPDIPGGQARQVENYYLRNSH